MGTLGWNIPVNERTEKNVCGLLVSLGWDGRVWPLDSGWPDGLQDEVGLRTLLRDARLFTSFVFPPQAQGSRVIRVDVAKTSGNFPLSPTVPAEDYEEPTEDQIEKFRSLIADPDIFLNEGVSDTRKVSRIARRLTR